MTQNKSLLQFTPCELISEFQTKQEHFKSLTVRIHKSTLLDQKFRQIPTEHPNSDNIVCTVEDAKKISEDRYQFKLQAETISGIPAGVAIKVTGDSTNLDVR